MKINTMVGKERGLLIGAICAGLIIPGALSAGENGYNSHLIELRVSSPVNSQEYGAKLQQLVSGSILKTYIVEYQYPNSSFRVLGMDIKAMDNEIYYTHLAPPNLFIQKGIRLHVGDSVIVRGAIMSIDQRSVFVANMISYRGQSIYLRTEQGIPTWTPGPQLGRSQLSQLFRLED